MSYESTKDDPAEGHLHRGEMEANRSRIDRVFFGLLSTIFVFIHSLSYVDGHDDLCKSLEKGQVRKGRVSNCKNMKQTRLFIAIRFSATVTLLNGAALTEIQIEDVIGYRRGLFSPSNGILHTKC